HIKVTFRNYFNSSVTFGVSKTEKGFSHLRRMYKESTAALEQKFFLGLGEIYFAWETVQAALEDEVKSKLQQFSKHLGGLGKPYQKEMETTINELLHQLFPFQAKSQICGVFLQWIH